MATVTTTKHRLKDNTEITIRNGIESDAEQMQFCVTEYIRDNAGQVWVPGEFSPTVEHEKVWINEMLVNDSELLLVAEVDGKIVGNIDFHIGKRKRIAHSGEFGMSVLPDWKDKGIGSILLKSLIAWAQSNPKIEKINLRVLSNNQPAIELYKKFGFKEEGRKYREVKYSDDIYADDIHMGLFLSAGS